MTLIRPYLSLSLSLRFSVSFLVSLSILFHPTVFHAARQIYFIRILVMGAFPMELAQPLFATFYRGTGSILVGEKKAKDLFVTSCRDRDHRRRLLPNIIYFTRD